MFIEDEISVCDFTMAISEAVDLASPVLSNHHRQVAYLSCRIAMEMKLPDDEIKDIALAAILHDIGAFSLEEQILIHNFKVSESDLLHHAEMGYRLLKDFEPLKKVAELIHYHHASHKIMQNEVPIGSYVINLADAIAILYDETTEVLEQVPRIIEKLASDAEKYHPETMAALKRLEPLEYFWIEACLLPAGKIIPTRIINSKKDKMDLEMLGGFAKVFSHVIDFRNRFTATHSSGVAAVAKEMTCLAGFSARECKLMEIAGYLHDLGKLSISDAILEKSGKLDHSEFNVMRKHTYYTYSILSKVKGLEQVAEWAAFHHEKLDGSGYPFHIKGEEMSKLSRIMAVADIFTAITEDRPYRDGMSEEETNQVLTGLVNRGGIDKSVVELAMTNFHLINERRITAQDEALRDYEEFHENL
jgi:HD-GYP domain-containing protein (c-di-GMP phosphodiesterase class II)